MPRGDDCVAPVAGVRCSVVKPNNLISYLVMAQLLFHSNGRLCQSTRLLLSSGSICVYVWM